MTQGQPRQRLPQLDAAAVPPFLERPFWPGNGGELELTGSAPSHDVNQELLGGVPHHPEAANLDASGFPRRAAVRPPGEHGAGSTDLGGKTRNKVVPLRNRNRQRPVSRRRLRAPRTLVACPSQDRRHGLATPATEVIRSFRRRDLGPHARRQRAVLPAVEGVGRSQPPLG